jgi:hypothetical protein
MMREKIKLVLLFVAICVALNACGHEHTYSEATCTNPKTCLECGATEGETLEHTWIDADCTTPKTCSTCGTTEGVEKGHSVKVGQCDVCGEIVQEKLVENICMNIINGFNSLDVASEYLNEADYNSLTSVYKKILLAETELDTTKSYFQQVYDSCGDYNELTEVKASVKSIMNAMPSEVEGSDSTSIIAWMTDYQSLIDVSMTECQKLNDVAKIFGE